jgi:hypothetical protein
MRKETFKKKEKLLIWSGFGLCLLILYRLCVWFEKVLLCNEKVKIVLNILCISCLFNVFILKRENILSKMS